jgi:hypothetical protein
MANTEIQQLVQSFVTQIEAAAKKAAIEQVLAQIGGQAAPKRRGPGRPKGTGGGGGGIKSIRKGKRRSAEDVAAMGETLVSYVKANPGARADQIASALRTDPGTIRLPMQALLAAKKVKTQGQRRGTKYYLPGAMPAGRGKKK